MKSIYFGVQKVTIAEIEGICPFLPYIYNSDIYVFCQILLNLLSVSS